MLLKDKEPRLSSKSRGVLQIKLRDCSKLERVEIAEFLFSKIVKTNGGSIYIDAY
jgi:hypothetical protein